MGSTETLWFRIFALIVTGIIAGYAIANVVYYNRIRATTVAMGGVTHGEATAMVWASVFIFIISAILFIWSLVRIILSPRSRTKIIKRLDRFSDSEDTYLVDMPDEDESAPVARRVAPSRVDVAPDPRRPRVDVPPTRLGRPQVNIPARLGRPQVDGVPRVGGLRPERPRVDVPARPQDDGVPLLDGR